MVGTSHDDVPAVPELLTRPPSLHDVARHAGVSHQTVSRVMNSRPNISEKTRAKVVAAIKELNYRPNPAARMLVTSRSRTIGVLSSSQLLYGPISSVEAIEKAARGVGYDVATANVDINDQGAVRSALDYFMATRVEGIIVLAPRIQTLKLIAELNLDLPVVTLQAGDRPDLLSVSVDQVSGARMATRHLIELGHRHIVHVGGPSDWIEGSDRAHGYGQQMSESGLTPEILEQPGWTAQSGYMAGTTVAKTAATAVFTANDRLALGTIHALHNAGKRVPEDVSVVGFDDMPDATHYLPPLTTVRQDFAELGRRSVTMILAQLDRSEESPANEVITPTLVVRSSTATPRVTRGR
jgi:DNA-binding LacI/PurR family transcriptional regulator